MESAKSLIENHTVKVFYFAVLILLVFMIVMHLRVLSEKKKEHIIGTGMAESVGSITSGADVRFQQFSSTNQGATPVYIKDLKEMYPGLYAQENLTATREPPVFYDISRTLDNYQQSYNPNAGAEYNAANSSHEEDVKGMKYSGVERQTVAPSTAVQEALLMRQLGY